MATLAPYQRIARSLRDQIVGGVYKPGAALPSVREITAEEETSKATVEKALRILKDEKLIESHAGVGLVVTEHTRVNAPRDMFLRTTGLSQGIRLPNEKTEFKYVGYNKAPRQLAPLLNVAFRADVLSRTRIIKRSGTPIMMASSWYPKEYEEVAPKLLKRESIPEGTPKYVAEQLGTTLGKGNDRISMDRLPPDVAWDLEVAPDDQVLYIENQVLSTDGRVIEVGAYHLVQGHDVRYDYELMHEESE